MSIYILRLNDDVLSMKYALSVTIPQLQPHSITKVPVINRQHLHISCIFIDQRSKKAISQERRKRWPSVMAIRRCFE
jgi:hypothetical protein